MLSPQPSPAAVAPLLAIPLSLHQRRAAPQPLPRVGSSLCFFQAIYLSSLPLCFNPVSFPLPPLVVPRLPAPHSLSAGLQPADLYGKFTWKIENFSEISKRELRSNVFEVGGYKWYVVKKLLNLLFRKCDALFFFFARWRTRTCVPDKG